MKAVIRAAKPEDVEEILNVRKITWIDTYPNEPLGITKEEIEEKFKKEPPSKADEWKESIKNDPSVTAWIAAAGDKVVGFIMVRKMNDINFLAALYILPEFQGHGLGTSLTEEAFKWFDADKNTELGVASYNTKTIDFYKKLGFEIAGDDEDYILPFGSVMPGYKMVRRATRQTSS